MALFGKKKKPEQDAPTPAPEDEIQFGGEADEADFGDLTDAEEDGDGQVINFDSIADELNDDDGGSEMGDPMGNAAVADDDAFDMSGAGGGDDPFNTAPGFETGASGDAGLDANDELDFNAVFDDGSPATTSAAMAQSGENPFGNAPSIEPVNEAQTVTTDAPPLTYTAPMTTADISAGGNAPAVKKSLPLLPLLGAAGLLLALGAVGYTMFGPSSSVDDEAPIITQNPALPATETTDVTPTDPAVTPVTDPATSGGIPVAVVPNNAVNPGIAVDGVPIAPGVVVQQAPIGAPLSSAPRPTVPLTPTLQKQLKELWNKGARAKRANDFAGARAAWQQMLQLRPNHPGIQSAIDKLPSA